MNKFSARESILEKLKSHNRKYAAQKSLVIKEKLTSLNDFIKAKDIFVYISNDTEVNTRDIVKTSIKLGKKVYCPIIKNGQINAGKLKGSALKPGKFGILEPEKTSKKNKFDVIIVPGVAFDKNGSRIGRGGGYFDAFLAKTGGQRIALAFDFQLLDKIETQYHDIPMDMIITEKRIIAIKKPHKK